MIHISMMGLIIFIDVLTHIPKNNMNNHPVVLINTITWFSLSKVLRSWKLHVGRSMAYKPINAYLACSKLGPTKSQKCSKLAPIVLGLDSKACLNCKLPLFYLCSHKLMINFVTVAMYIHMTFARIANWWQKSDNQCDCCSH